jgi:hypothetical protein
MASESNFGPQRTHGPMRLILPISVAYDLEKFQRALTNLAQLVGGDGWTSTADVHFLHGREFVVDPTSLQAREVGQQ